LDREGRDPYELLDEIEEKLNIKVRPLSWPISMGKTFKGVYSLFQKSLLLFQSNKQKATRDGISIQNLDDEQLDKLIGKNDADKLREDIELIEGVYPEFDIQAYLQGKVAPVFFGSAVNNFGVQELLDCFVEIAPPPLPRETEEREISPQEKKFSGFVFKIHANMDPKH